MQSDEKIQSEINQIFNSIGRFREETIHRKFNFEQRKYIEKFEGETFKIKMLRAVGLGKCGNPDCNNSTGYVEKLRFYAYCSKDCEFKPRRANDKKERLAELIALLESNDIKLLDPENYVNSGSSCSFYCNRCKHEFHNLPGRILDHTCVSDEEKALRKIKYCDKCSNILPQHTRNTTCQKCISKAENEAISNRFRARLAEMGLTTEVEDIHDRLKRHKFTHTCGHSFVAMLGNAMTGYEKCEACVPKVQTKTNHRICAKCGEMLEHTFSRAERCAKCYHEEHREEEIASEKTRIAEWGYVYISGPTLDKSNKRYYKILTPCGHDWNVQFNNLATSMKKYAGTSKMPCGVCRGRK